MPAGKRRRVSKGTKERVGLVDVECSIGILCPLLVADSVWIKMDIQQPEVTSSKTSVNLQQSIRSAPIRHGVVSVEPEKKT